MLAVPLERCSYSCSTDNTHVYVPWSKVTTLHAMMVYWEVEVELGRFVTAEMSEGGTTVVWRRVPLSDEPAASICRADPSAVKIPVL
jgi:hypothetical protein